PEAPPPFDAMPKDVSTAELTLDRSFVRLVKGSPEAVGVTLGLPSAKWTILPDQFEVALTKIGIVVVKETGLRVWGTLTGKMKLGDEELEATIEAPEFILRARQNKPLALKLGSVFDNKLFSGFPKLDLPEVVIDDLRLNLYCKISPIQYDFSLRFKEGMKLAA